MLNALGFLGANKLGRTYLADENVICFLPIVFADDGGTTAPDYSRLAFTHTGGGQLTARAEQTPCSLGVRPSADFCK